ncbi:hypothetical protein [Microcoleus sp. Pol10D4]|uniref:hypothetical protein n=1 Tax=Microcoleus sp. Pol10D4 TaxID=3055387 RepID=UPI002FD2DE34
MTDVTIAAYIECGGVEDVKYARYEVFFVDRQQDGGSSSRHWTGSDVNHRKFILSII